MEELTTFEHYVKAVIEAYGTQPGKPLDIPDSCTKQLCKKLLELARIELEPEFKKDEKEYLKTMKELGESMILVTDKILKLVEEKVKEPNSIDELRLALSLTNKLEEIHDSFIKEINSF